MPRLIFIKNVKTSKVTGSYPFSVGKCAISVRNKLSRFAYRQREKNEFISTNNNSTFFDTNINIIINTNGILSNNNIEKGSNNNLKVPYTELLRNVINSLVLFGPSASLDLNKSLKDNNIVNGSIIYVKTPFS